VRFQEARGAGRLGAVRHAGSVLKVVA
jgi:hypothetical protein